jgi:hypothetical protein
VKRGLLRAWRYLLPALSLALALSAVSAWASSSTGWNHLGDKGSPNGAVYVLNAISTPSGDGLVVGGNFTKSAGRDASHFDFYSVPGPHQVGGFVSNFGQLNGDVHAIAWDQAAYDIYVAGTFTDAGGHANADFLAYNPNHSSRDWEPACTRPPGQLPRPAA